MSGEKLRNNDHHCYLAVFGATSIKRNTWYLGTEIMSEFYTVFDMTPLEEEKKDFIQVGFARKNPDGIIFYSENDDATPQDS